MRDFISLRFTRSFRTLSEAQGGNELLRIKHSQLETELGDCRSKLKATEQSKKAVEARAKKFESELISTRRVV